MILEESVTNPSASPRDGRDIFFEMLPSDVIPRAGLSSRVGVLSGFGTDLVVTLGIGLHGGGGQAHEVIRRRHGSGPVSWPSTTEQDLE